LPHFEFVNPPPINTPDSNFTHNPVYEISSNVIVAWTGSSDGGMVDMTLWQVNSGFQYPDYIGRTFQSTVGFNCPRALWWLTWWPFANNMKKT
jgi:hypothetical protein